jgi:hypothetical protein
MTMNEFELALDALIDKAMTEGLANERDDLASALEEIAKQICEGAYDEIKS